MSADSFKIEIVAGLVLDLVADSSKNMPVGKQPMRSNYLSVELSNKSVGSRINYKATGNAIHHQWSHIFDYTLRLKCCF